MGYPQHKAAEAKQVEDGEQQKHWKTFSSKTVVWKNHFNIFYDFEKEELPTG